MGLSKGGKDTYTGKKNLAFQKTKNSVSEYL